ncbi:MAG: PAS domain S-box protein [Mongoliitalea sp.]
MNLTSSKDSDYKRLQLENKLLKVWMEHSQKAPDQGFNNWWESTIPEVCKYLGLAAFCILDCDLEAHICEHLIGWFPDRVFDSQKFLTNRPAEPLLFDVEKDTLTFDQLIQLEDKSLFVAMLQSMGMTHVIIKKIDNHRITLLGLAFEATIPSDENLKLIEILNSTYRNLHDKISKELVKHEQLIGLQCLNKLASIGEETSLTIDGYLEKIINLIPSGFTNSDNIHVTVEFEGNKYHTDKEHDCNFFIQEKFTSVFIGELTIKISRNFSFQEDERFFLDTLTKNIGHRLIKKKSIQALQQSELRLKNLLNSQTNYFLRTNLEGRHIYWNKTFEDAFGWIYEGIPFDKHYALTSIAEYHHQRTIDTVEKCIKHPQEIFQVELDKPKYTGGTRTTLWEFVCLLDEFGNPYEIQCMGIDITNRKQAEIELATSEFKYRFLFDHSPNGVLLIKDGKFIECNLATLQMLGAEKDYVIGKTPAEISPEYQPNGNRSSDLEQVLLNLTNKGEEQSFEWIHLRKDGDSLIVNIFISKLSIESEEMIFVVWDDITEKKASEEKLRKLSLAVEQNPLSIIITNLEGNIEYANTSTFSVTGYSPEELIGKNPRILKSGLTPNDQHEQLWSNITQGDLWQGLLYNRKKSGEIYTEKATISPIKDEKGKITHYIAIKEDITEKLKTEHDLALSEERFRQIAEYSQTVIWEVDLNGLYTYISPVAKTVFGYEPEELTGKKHFFDLHPENLQEDFKELALQLVESGSIIKDFENPIQKKDGEVIWVSTNATPILGQNKEIIGYRGSDSNITERKIAEEQLKEQNDRLNAIISANPDLIFILDHNEKIISYYANSEEDLLIPADQIINSDLLTIFGEEGRLIHAIPLKKCIQSQRRVTYEYDLQFNDKPEFYESRMVPLSNNRVLAFIRNISDRVKAEKGLIELNMLLEERVIERTQELDEARKEAENANLAKSEFLSRMSHELRTPMNSILGFAQLMEMGELSEKQSKSISQILKSGRHLLDLINEILDIAKIDAGKISLSLEPVQIRPVLVEMMDTVSPLAMKNQIDVEFMECGEFDSYIYADKQRLKQILLNLINNAIKYNHPNGKVWVGCQKLIDEFGKERIKISIKDNGFGIAREDFERIFNPFERANTGNVDIEGTGLGLAVVKKLTEVMNGTIGIESELGSGSVFTIEFEKVKCQEMHQQLISNPEDVEKFKKETPPATVLYIEDNSANLELIDTILQSTRPSLQLISTIYGKHAVQLAKEYRPQLILLDLNLPDIHGREVIKELKSDMATMGVPVIIVSADATDAQIQQLLSLGALAYLTKPIDIQLLLLHIDQVINF